MPSPTILTASARLWGLAASVALGTIGTVEGSMELAARRLADEIANADLKKTTYTDDRRTENHDEHRTALIDDFLKLHDALKSDDADDDEDDPAANYTPWEYRTP